MSGIFHPDENHIKFGGGQNACSRGKACLHCARNNTLVEKTQTSSNPVTPAYHQSHRQFDHSSNSGICNMSKHRVIEARPHLLPVAAHDRLPRSKTWRSSIKSKPPLPVRSNLSDSRLQTISYNGDASDSDVSVFTNDNDTSSIFSDTVSSVLNEDFNQALTLSFKPSSDNELLDPNLPISDHIFASVPNQENTSPNSDITSLVDDTSILEHTDLKLMSLPSSFSHNADVPSVDISVDQSSDITSFSCSSMSMDQDGLLLSDQFSARNPSKCVSPGMTDEEKQTLENEIRHLKQSLKLSEADTAILVSAKQQLQLDLHDSTENVKNLRIQLQKALVSSAQHEKNSIVLKAKLEKEREKYGSDLQLTKSSLDQLRLKLEKVTTDYDDVWLEKDDFKLQCKNLSREKETLENHNKNLQKEIDQLTIRNSKLTSVVNKSNEDNAGNQEYIDIIRAERDDYVKRLHEMEQADMQHKIAIRGFEERVTQLNEVNLKLSMDKDNLHKSSQEQSDLISSLQTQLALKLNEKEALDGAVSRLHGDLHKVEAGFTKIKKEIALKSGVAERELSLNNQLKAKVAKLEGKIQQLTLQAKVHTQRISDKNNQIVQLINQVKSANNDKSSEASEVTRLKSSLTNMEKKWTEVVEREKSLAKDLKLKEMGLSASERKCKDLETDLNLERSKQSNFEVEIRKLNEALSARDAQIKNIQKDLLDIESKHKMEQQTVLDSVKQERTDLEKETQALIAKVENLQKQLFSQKSVDHQDENNSHQHMELLAELQKSRWELVSQISTMQNERGLLVSEHQKEVDILTLRLNDQLVLYEKFNAEHSEKEQLLVQNTNNMKQQLTEQMKIADDLKLALSHMTDKFAAEKEVHNESENLLKKNAKEIASLQNKIRNLNEELTMVKQEMNNNAVKLMEDLHQKTASQVEENEIGNQLRTISEERDKLREAVDQQQRYMVALQTHYQQWATQAAAQLKLSQETKQQTEHIQKDSSTQTDHDNDPVIVIPTVVTMETSSQTDHDNDPVNAVPAVVTMEMSSQTDHDNDPVIVIPTVVTMETSSQTDHDNDPVNAVPAVVTMEMSSQTDHDNDPVIVIPTVVTMETSSQTDHDNDPVNAVPAVVTMEMSSQTDHDNDPVIVVPHVVTMETSSQTDPINNPENKVPAVVIIETSSQTNHDNDPVIVIPAAVTMETSSQTDHDNDHVNVGPSVVTMETSSQTDHDNDPVIVIPAAVTMETSSQTDHDNDHVNVGPSVVTMEAFSQTDHDNEAVVVIPAVVTMETSSQTDYSNDPVNSVPAVVTRELSSQTDHVNDPVIVIPSVFTVETSSQTDHDNDPVLVIPPVVPIETSTQTDHMSERFDRTSLSYSLTEHLTETDHITKNICVPSYLVDASNISTQTDLDSDQHTIIPSLNLTNSVPFDHTVKNVSHENDYGQMCDAPQTKQLMFDENDQASVKMVDNFTQTNHDEKPIASSPLNSPYKQRQASVHCSRCQELDNSRKIFEENGLKQSGHCELHNNSNLECNVDNDSSYMSHESLECFPLTHEPNHCLQCEICNRNHSDANTQTDHDLQPIFSRSSYNPQLQNTETQTEVALCERLKFDEPGLKMWNTREKNLFKTPVSLNSYFPSSNDVSVQTRNEQNENKSILKNCDCQTDLHLWQGNILESHTTTTQTDILTNCSQTTQTELNFGTLNSSTQTEHNNINVGKPSLEPRFLNEKEVASMSTRTVLPNYGFSDQCYCDDICRLCGQLPIKSRTSVFVQTEETGVLSSLPNPSEVARILSSGDASKLKAYKNTVNVLKRKLKSAQETISEQDTSISALQGDLSALKTLLESKNASEKEVRVKGDGLGFDRLQEELKNWKGVAENKEYESSALKAEIEKLKHGYETEIEKQRQKSIARRKLQEKKIKDANERVVALVDANGKLRRSVEKLQVKLTSCSQQLEVSQREKLRYQNRARKLQANLRSLSWLTTSNSEANATEKSQTKSLPEEVKLKKRDSLEIPSSVKDIENVLSNLKCEISSLEKQLSDHNDVVNQSKASWKEIRRPLLSKNKSDSAETKPILDDGLGEIV